MSNRKMSKNVTAEYTSFEELRKAFGLKPITKRTKDKNKLNTQREKFMNRHKCKACGKPMTYGTGNVMSCTNPECKGIEMEGTDGTKYYIPSYDLLDTKGAEIASNIFD